MTKRTLASALNAAYNLVMEQRDAVLAKYDRNGPTDYDDQCKVRELNSLLRDLWDHYVAVARAPLHVRLWRAFCKALPLDHIGG